MALGHCPKGPSPSLPGGAAVEGSPSPGPMAPHSGYQVLRAPGADTVAEEARRGGSPPWPPPIGVIRSWLVLLVNLLIVWDWFA